MRRSLLAIAVTAVAVSISLAAILLFQPKLGPGIPTNPRVSEKQAVEAVMADLQSSGANTTGLRIYNSPVDEFLTNHTLPLLRYTVANGTTYFIDKDTHAITESCTAERDCSWGQSQKLIYTLEVSWRNPDDAGAENYVVDAMNGDILYKTTRPR